MSVVKDFNDATFKLIELLEKENQVERDVKIEKIQELLEKREGFMGSMKPPFTQSEQDLGKLLIEMNQKLTKLLESEKTAIQKDLKKLHVKKESTTKYAKPYQSLSTDGVFYDKRK
jgi:flagellar protein FliT